MVTADIAILRPGPHLVGCAVFEYFEIDAVAAPQHPNPGNLGTWMDVEVIRHPGPVRVGERASGMIAGRSLPVLAIHLDAG